MANTITATYAFTLPEVGGDTNAWGGHLNGNFTIIDNQMVSRTVTSAQTLLSALNLPSNGLNVGSGQLAVSSGNVTASGNISATGNLGGVNGVLSGTLGVSGSATFSSTLAVTGAVTLGSTLAVTGAATFSTTVTASTAPSAGGHLTNKTYVDGQIASAQSAAIGLAAPSGAVMAFAMNKAPTGWLSADGSAVSRTTYAALFAAIGTTFGAGDGYTTFNLPDLSGYFIRGSGTNGDGTASGTFGAKQGDDVKPHNHSITDPGHYHGMGVYNQPSAGAGTVGTNVVLYGSGLFTGAATTGITINNSTGAETRPKNIALLYCIKT